MQIKKLCLVPLFLVLFCSHVITSSYAYSFMFDYFGNGTDLVTFSGDAEYGPEFDGMSKSGAIGLTQDKIPYSHGRALFVNPVPFKPNSSSSSSVYSFKTFFTFSITSPLKSNPNHGHGLAFIIVPSNKNHDVSGLGYLSLLNRKNDGNTNNHLFAVEFDVFKDKSLGDINANHVGININSAKSTVSKKAGYWVHSKTGWLFKELNLFRGGVGPGQGKYQVWIEYENSKVSVTIAPGYEKPKRPLIEAKIDLSKVFLEKMYTGFAGSMGRGVERHEIWEWRFENTAQN